MTPEIQRQFEMAVRVAESTGEPEHLDVDHCLARLKTMLAVLRRGSTAVGILGLARTDSAGRKDRAWLVQPWPGKDANHAATPTNSKFSAAPPFA
jgi:hypothetical protein